MLGVALAILSSFSFSMNSVMSRRALAVSTASAGAFVTVMIGVPLFLLAALVTGQLFNAGDLPLNGYVLLASAGVLHFGLGRYFNYRAASAIGATRASSVQAVVVPYAIFIAWVFLGEAVTLTMGVGIVLILVGPSVMIERTPRKAGVRTPPSGGAIAERAPAFQLRQTEGYLSALATAGAYGTSPILIRAALGNTEGLSIFGGLVAYTAAAVVLLSIVALPAQRGLISQMRPGTLRLFLGAGSLSFLAQMLRFMAFAVAPVAVVTPLMRTSSMFTLVLSWTVNRHLEAINLRVVAGILISVSGAVMLAFSGA